MARKVVGGPPPKSTLEKLGLSEHPDNENDEAGLTLSRAIATDRRAGLAGRILPPRVKAFVSGLRST